MIISLFLLTFRYTWRVPYAKSVVIIYDFGLLKGGTTRITLNNNLTRPSGKVKLYLLTKWQYDKFDKNFLVNLGNCHIPDYSAEHFMDLSNYGPKVFNDVVNEKSLYYVVLLQCNRSQLTNHDYYFYDQVFLNPGNQQLDYREIPNLALYPVSIVLFGALLLYFLGLFFYHKMKFLKIYALIITCCSLYIVYLLLYLIEYFYDWKNERPLNWIVCLNVFFCLYSVFQYSLIFVATSGWCILNTKLGIKDALLSIVSAFLFYLSIFLQVTVNMGMFIIVLLLLDILCPVLMIRAIFRNTRNAEVQINAHMRIIAISGIDPTTTPIFKKLNMYKKYNCIIMLLLGIDYLKANLFTRFDSYSWIKNMVDNIIQFFIILTTMATFRPRGKEIDPYMRSDKDDDGERDIVKTEELKGFNPENGGGAKWNSGMALPLQPNIVDYNNAISKNSLKKKEAFYTFESIQEPLEPNRNYA